ncbi:leucine-rich repeat domain-containing protein [Breznakiellaceae bacterium SP9]
MKHKTFVPLFCIISLALSLVSCASSNGTQTNTPQIIEEPDAPNQSPAVQPAPAPTAPAPADSAPAQPSNPYFSGDGRNDMSLAILEPDSKYLDKDREYLPLMIQGCLVANISKYSAIKVLDRVALDKVIAETLGPTYKDNLDIVRLGNVTQTDYIMTGDIIKTSYGYTLTINVTDTTPNPQTIAYSGTCTLSQLDDQSVIQLASKELLAKMNVNLSDRAIAELSTTNERSIFTQTNVAKGLYAQLQGFEIEALTYYLQVAKFDPSLPEAVNRSEVLAANISSGRIGNDLRNSGVIDYKTETTGFTGIKALLRVGSPDWRQSIEKAVQTVNDSERDMQKAEQDLQGKIAEVQRMVQAEQAAMEAAIQEVVQAVNDGLNATGRQRVWLLEPLNVSLTKAQFNRSLLKTAKPYVPPINKSGSVSFSVSVELVNGRNKVIGTNTFRTSGTYSITSTGASVSDAVLNTVDFANVNVNDITDNLTIRIAGVNGKPAASASRSDGLQIQAVNLSEWNSAPWDYTIQKGQITQYRGNDRSVTIPRTIWGETVTSIGNNVFAGSKVTSVTIGANVISIGDNAFANSQLTRVTILNGVTSIGNSAFRDNQLTSVTIPGSVTSIGNLAFSGNRLTSVTIPNSVTSIGDSAFSGNPLTSVTIEENVSLGSSAIGSGFEALYNHNGKLAGTYMRPDNNSSTWGNNLEELVFSFDPATGTITGYNGSTTYIVIPETIGGVPVTAIENDVFLLAVPKEGFVWELFPREHLYWKITLNDKGRPMARSVSAVIKIGKDIKFDNLAFFGTTFGEYYSEHGRKAGTYSYAFTRYTTSEYIQDGFGWLTIPTMMMPPIWAGINGLFAIIVYPIPKGSWGWNYTP